MTAAPIPTARTARGAVVLTLALAALTGCERAQPDRSLARVGVAEREAPSAPIVAPDTTGAIWADEGGDANRLVYGRPGLAPFFSLACTLRQGQPMLAYTRFASADRGAKAILALIGNRHVARWKIDAVDTGGRWLWRGSVPTATPEADVFAGLNRVEATVPGAGSLILNASPLPGDLVTRCRSLAPPAAQGSAPAATGAAPSALPGTTDTAAPPPPPAR